MSEKDEIDLEFDIDDWDFLEEYDLLEGLDFPDFVKGG